MFGKRHGKGAYHYADGGRYEVRGGDEARRALVGGAPTPIGGSARQGEWVDDQIHGSGKSFYANGNVYDGEVRELGRRARGRTPRG